MKSPAELRRQAAFVLHTAEWTLGRPVRSVLDVGCGEGNWQPVLRAMRPRIAYTGVDPSEYAVARFGRRRGLLLGSIEELDREPLASRLDPHYDLVVCCGMLNYLSARQFRAGIARVARRTGGLAYLEIFARGDQFEGDTDWPAPKPAGWYRDVMEAAGLRSVGMQCWVPANGATNISMMEWGSP